LKKILHDFIIITVHESAINGWLFLLPLEQSDHVASKDTLKNRGREVDIVDVDIVKEVLQGGVVLNNVDDQ
jgi:hypothetical protein